jgi:hypothetical protein
MAKSNGKKLSAAKVMAGMEALLARMDPAEMPELVRAAGNAGGWLGECGGAAIAPRGADFGFGHDARTTTTRDRALPPRRHLAPIKPRSGTHSPFRH